MKARQTEIQITISQREGLELRNQILKALGGNDMPLHGEQMRGTPLAHLFELLSTHFEHSKQGANFL
jgi:hypothetical protein